MLAIFGMALVFLAVLGGFVMEHGKLWVLVQPAELLIILGGAAGILLTANPWGVVVKLCSESVAAFRPPAHTRKSYLQHLRLLYEIFVFTQRNGGVSAIESHVEDPANSAIFANHPELLKDTGTRAFICDSLRMLVIGATTPQELDLLMDLDIDIQRRGQHEPAKALSSIADSLPGLGIVAAVLGVVITMEAVGGAPEVVGQKVAAALVGTFLGILMCYGVAGPMAARLETVGEMQAQFLQVLRICMIAFARGSSPILAVEYARRSIPIEVRPGFVELETCIRRDAMIPSNDSSQAQKGNANASAA